MYIYTHMYTHYISHLYSSVDEYLGCFHVLAILNSFATNTGVHVSFQIIVLSRYMSRSGIINQMATLFRFLKNLRNCFPWWLHQFPFPPAVWEGSLFSTSSPAFVTCRHLTMAALTNVRWHLIVVFICISLAISSVKHLFMRLLAIHVTSLEKYLFTILCPFFDGLFGFFFVTELYELSVYFGN